MALIEIVGIIIGAFAIFISLLYWHRKSSQQILLKAGVIGPKPNWLFGNLHQMTSPPMYELIPEWTKKYGPTWGYYEGPTPIIVTSDVELLQEVFIKQFRNFYGRKLFPVQEDPDKDEEANLFTARGQKWKQLRSTLNPSFTESRMKQMFPLIDKCIGSMMNSIDKKVKEQKNADDGIDIYQFFQLLTLDTICECAFGVELDTQNDVNNPVIENLRTFLNQDFSKGSPLFITGLIFPELSPFLYWLQKVTTSGSSPFPILTKMMENVVKKRKESLKDNHSANSRVDLLQLLLESEVCPVSRGSCVIPTNTIDQDLHDLPDSPPTTPTINDTSPHKFNTQKKLHLSMEVVKAQAILFLFAGYETSSTALGYCAYELARNPHVLSRLHDEIDSALQDLSDEDKSCGNVNFYKAICNLPYLEAVIWETLRIYPFVGLLVNRRCMTTDDVKIKDMNIPQGVIIAPDMYSIHYNEDLWGPIDVNKFDPDRHLELKSNGKIEFINRHHTMSMLAFGAGPKNCIGKRFALMEIRASLVRLLTKFTLEKCKQTPGKLPLRIGSTVAPKEGVLVKITTR